jgi:hypothetical protein
MTNIKILGKFYELCATSFPFLASVIPFPNCFLHPIPTLLCQIIASPAAFEHAVLQKHDTSHLKHNQKIT